MRTANMHGSEASHDGPLSPDASHAALPPFPETLLQVGTSLHATLIVDRHQRIARVDEALTLASGWTGKAPQGRSAKEVLGTLPWLLEALDIALTGKAAVGMTAQVRAPVLPVFGEGGQLLGACACLSTDENSKTGPALREELALEFTQLQQRYEELIDTFDGVVWEAVASNFRITFISQQAERLLGYPSEQWRREPDFWVNHLHPEDRDWVKASCQKGTREGRAYALEYRMVAADGGTVWVRNTIKVLAEEGHPTRLRGLLVDITEQRRALEQQERTVSLLRTTLDSITDGVFVVDRNLRITAYNKQFQEIWGFPDEVLQGEPHLEKPLGLALPLVKDPEGFTARVREIYADPELEGIDLVELRNGRILERITRPQRLGDTIIGRICSYRDITAERQAREKQEQTVSLLRATFDSTADGVVAVDRDGRINTYNKRFQRLWGLPDDLLLTGLDAMASVTAAAPLVKEPERFVAQLQEMFKVSDQEYVDTIEFRDGRILERTSLPQRLGDTIIGRVWSYRDVTEERHAKAAQERLLEAEQRARAQLEESFALLDTFLNNAPMGMGFLDRDLRYIRLNDALAGLHGHRREEELGRTLREMTPHVAAAVEPLMRQVLETGQPIIGLDLTGEVPATPGALRFWRVSYYPIRTPRGGIVGVGAVVVEVTEERRAQEERERLLREAHEAIQIRDDFLSIASHELKTPLTPLKIHLQVLKQRCASGHPVPPQLAEKALSQVARLSGLISDLLDASQVEAGQLSVVRGPMPLRALVREVLAEFRPPSSHHRLVHEEWPEELLVEGDRRRIAQVLTNLLENALKYSPQGGPIHVALTRTGSEAIVSVSDSGIGIPADQQAQLFERFFRARNAPISGFGGLGLGLYICRDIIERHGGRIWVESELGHGATFRFSLPLSHSLP
ncbi:PAS domain-containing sensor histidine kinase [Hyalangium rubrum]|uniref:histidine kinase n=1 Tax=Hyalangium rubrum TaxID=3103134 RepID=A0ABU5GXH8_9BACT|nr:PAS domain-containing protein [Hyalangium sp. s54d21]MDY7225564.1 PAS domain-containing protein [Hyalangium sp. s54d21]